MSYYADKICHLQLNSKQIILFRLKSHYFRTYFLYMIRYNNVSRPVIDPHDPPLRSPRPPAENWGSYQPNPQDRRLCMRCVCWDLEHTIGLVTESWEAVRPAS